MRQTPACCRASVLLALTMHASKSAGTGGMRLFDKLTWKSRGLLTVQLFTNIARPPVLVRCMCACLCVTIVDMADDDGGGGGGGAGVEMKQSASHAHTSAAARVLGMFAGVAPIVPHAIIRDVRTRAQQLLRAARQGQHTPWRKALYPRAAQQHLGATSAHWPCTALRTRPERHVRRL